MKPILLPVVALSCLLPLASCGSSVKAEKVTKDSDPASQVSYFTGFQAGQQSENELNLEAFIAGALDAREKKDAVIDQEQAIAALTALSKKNNEDNKKFLTENAKKPNVKTTASGLQYIVNKEGTGKKAAANSKVTVDYEGKLVDGTVFDSSKKAGKPVTFSLNEVIPGWKEGISLMKENGNYTLFIPSKLAYGEEGVPGAIPPNSVLIFDVDLLKVE